MNNKQLFDNFGPFSSEDYLELFQEPNLDHNKKEKLFLKKFKKIVSSDTVAHCIFKDFSKSEIVFDAKDLDFVFSNISIENFSKKEILNILLSINQEFIDKILEQNLFDKIYIINDVADFEKEALNIDDNKELSSILLEKKGLKPEIFIKRLFHKNGSYILENFDHLDKCLYLLPNDDNNFKNEQCLDFMINLDLNDLKKIMSKFNLRKYLFRFLKFRGFFM